VKLKVEVKAIEWWILFGLKMNFEDVVLEQKKLMKEELPNFDP